MSDRHPDLQHWMEGELSSDDCRTIESHIKGCSTCRLQVAETDPSLLFRLLSLESIPEGVLDRVSTRATGAIAREVESRSGRRWAGWAAVAASFVLAFWFGAYLWDSPIGEFGAPTAPSTARSAGDDRSGTAVPASMFEVLESPGDADVFEFSLDGDVQVAMIFDTELEI